jgi:hypothetical protein
LLSARTAIPLFEMPPTPALYVGYALRSYAMTPKFGSDCPELGVPVSPSEPAVARNVPAALFVDSPSTPGAMKLPIRMQRKTRGW